MSRTEKNEDDVVALIAKARELGEQWFELKITVPYTDDDKEAVAVLENNLTEMLLDGLEIISSDKVADLPEIEVPPAIILPN